MSLNLHAPSATPDAAVCRRFDDMIGQEVRTRLRYLKTQDKDAGGAPWQVDGPVDLPSLAKAMRVTWRDGKSGARTYHRVAMRYRRLVEAQSE